MKKSILILMAVMAVLFTACSNKDTKIKETDKTYPPMVKVKGTTYVTTGYENAMVTCGTADGEIKTTVDGKNKPENDDESNFGKGYGYQVWENGYINVEIDKRWILFKDIELKDDGQIPEWVGHFTAKVIQTEEDSIMVEVTDIDEKFHLENLKSKPILLSIDNLENAKDGKITTEGLEGKTVEVYFGGEIKNIEPESSVPISFGKIYRIEVK